MGVGGGLNVPVGELRPLLVNELLLAGMAGCILDKSGRGGSNRNGSNLDGGFLRVGVGGGL